MYYRKRVLHKSGASLLGLLCEDHTIECEIVHGLSAFEEAKRFASFNRGYLV